MNKIYLLPASMFGFFVGKLYADTKPKPSPLRGVPIDPWERFVFLMACAPKNHISPRYRLGRFQMDARSLSDLGYMRNPRKGNYEGSSGVWLGDFADPLTEHEFLGSMPLQYAAFVRSMQAAAPKVSGYVGKKVDGIPCSLSGLLSVSHVAGETGLSSWVEGDRRLPKTTEVFRRTNGIF